MASDSWKAGQSESWEDRRTRLSHDWLKIYLRDLGKWHNILSGEVEDPGFETRFVKRDMHQWRTRRAELLTLADDFSLEMSPTVLFRRGPLQRCSAETVAWLGPLLHELWCHRLRVSEKVNGLVASLNAVDLAYLAVVQTASVDTSVTTEAPDAALDRVNALSAACSGLSTALRVFPKRIVVT